MGHLGFSQRLLTKIVECNTAVENWVQREKQAADDMEAEFRRTLVKEQTAIDVLNEDLLSLRFKLGMAIQDGRDRVDGSHDGILQKQQRLLQAKQQIEREVEALKTDKANAEENIRSKQECLTSVSMPLLTFTN